jgi:hypothetical protein
MINLQTLKQLDIYITIFSVMAEQAKLKVQIEDAENLICWYEGFIETAEGSPRASQIAHYQTLLTEKRKDVSLLKEKAALLQQQKENKLSLKKINTQIDEQLASGFQS